MTISLGLTARVSVAMAMVTVFSSAEAQISTPPRVTAGNANAVGLGLSYGEQQDREADFWGWSAEYSRLVNDSWTAGLSLTWDEETE